MHPSSPILFALNPLGPGWYLGILGHALRYAGRYDEALETLSEYNRRSPGFGLVDVVLTFTETRDIERRGDTRRSFSQPVPNSRLKNGP